MRPPDEISVVYGIAHLLAGIHGLTVDEVLDQFTGRQFVTGAYCVMSEQARMSGQTLGEQLPQEKSLEEQSQELMQDASE